MIAKERIFKMLMQQGDLLQALILLERQITFLYIHSVSLKFARPSSGTCSMLTISRLISEVDETNEGDIINNISSQFKGGRVFTDSVVKHVLIGLFLRAEDGTLEIT